MTVLRNKKLFIGIVGAFLTLKPWTNKLGMKQAVTLLNQTLCGEKKAETSVMRKRRDKRIEAISGIVAEVLGSEPRPRSRGLPR
jgi:hypothetical protein